MPNYVDMNLLHLSVKLFYLTVCRRLIRFESSGPCRKETPNDRPPDRASFRACLAQLPRLGARAAGDLYVRAAARHAVAQRRAGRPDRPHSRCAAAACRAFTRRAGVCPRPSSQRGQRFLRCGKGQARLLPRDRTSGRRGHRRNAGPCLRPQCALGAQGRPWRARRQGAGEARAQRLHRRLGPAARATSLPPSARMPMGC